MKKILLCLLVISIGQTSFGQDGPGGVGNSTNIEVWLDADRLGLTNSDPVSSWTDVSGNSNNADQGTASFQPTFVTNEINGFPAVSFDGVDDRLDFTTNVNNAAITLFSIHKRPTDGLSTLFFLGQHVIYTQNNGVATYYLTPTTKYAIGSHTNDTYQMFTQSTGSGATGVSLELQDGTTTKSFTRNALWSNSQSVLGARFASGTGHYLFFEGEVAEAVVYNEELNSASYNIVSNSLAAKYNVSTTPDLYAYEGSHNHAVKGIGQESDGSNTTARGNDFLEISNASSLGDGDYLLVGHDNGGYAVSASVPAGVVERWTQVWRADVTGSPGTISVEFFLDAGSFASPANYAVIIESADGDFSNGGTVTHETGRSYNAIDNSITFTGLTLADGDYFTLAELVSDITTDQAGPWNNVNTWSCGCIPGATDAVEVDHDVTISAEAEILNLTVNGSGSIEFLTADTLKVDGDIEFVSGSSLIPGTGTISIQSSSNAQTITNNSGGTISFNNLYVNNSGGLDLTNGTWELSNSLQVSAGGMDVSGATSFTLLSDASSTSQILESMDGAFTGNFTIQRYISSRNSNWSNMSSPIESATAADLDDNLVLSGIGGDDGNARANGGNTFYSIWTYNNSAQTTSQLTALTDDLTPGKGYEVYLATTAATFSDTTVDFVGVPNSGLNDGASRQILFRDWNLFGNPYHCHIDYDLLDKTFAPDNFYVFNSSTGSYDFYSGGGKPSIAPEQGFWVFKTVGGGHFFDFNEKDKVSSTSSTFLRKGESLNKDFSLTINTEENAYSHKMQIGFDVFSENGIDEKDAPFLRSPEESAPALYSNLGDGKSKLIYDSRDINSETQLIPISIDAGVAGNYSINGENMERVLQNYSCIYLEDKLEDKVIDLTIGDGYSFDSEVGEFDRFNLVMSNSYENCQKILENDFFPGLSNNSLDLRRSNDGWYLDINRSSEETAQFEVRVYNLAGQIIAEPSSFSVNKSGSIPLYLLNSLKGVHVIQVISKDQILNRTVNL